jgi:hypothetical protein
VCSGVPACGSHSPPSRLDIAKITNRRVDKSRQLRKHVNHLLRWTYRVGCKVTNETLATHGNGAAAPNNCDGREIEAEAPPRAGWRHYKTVADDASQIGVDGHLAHSRTQRCGERSHPGRIATRSSAVAHHHVIHARGARAQVINSPMRSTPVKGVPVAPIGVRCAAITTELRSTKRRSGQSSSVQLLDEMGSTSRQSLRPERQPRRGQSP